MSQAPFWMSFYVLDYLRDTMSLSNAEHGAYIKAILQYWVKQEALTDAELRGICQVEYNRIKEYFSWMDGRWHHKRIDIEIKKAADLMKKNKARSEIANAARWGKEPPKRKINGNASHEKSSHPKES